MFADNKNTILFKISQRQQKIKLSSIPCTICGFPSRGFIYGAMACDACKAFFKRNAQYGLNILKCHFNGHCEININTRHICAYCRLVKCFTNGMQKELLRCSHPIKNNIDKKRKLPPNDQINNIISKFSNQSNSFTQISTLNRLRTDQWNHLSKLLNYYDYYGGLSIGEKYLLQQKTLPPKLRFKSKSIIQLSQLILNKIQSLYKNNKDFLLLSLNDRSILFHNTLIHTACISMNFIFYKIQLINHPAYYYTIENIICSNEIFITKYLSQRFDFDVIIMKLFLIIFSFSTFRSTIYQKTSSDNLSNIQLILHIQNTYIELTWQYLLYKYNHKQAVKYFSDFIRCIFLMNDILVKAHDVQWFLDIINSITQD